VWLTADKTSVLSVLLNTTDADAEKYKDFTF
jgi:hypothetical protein